MIKLEKDIYKNDGSRLSKFVIIMFAFSLMANLAGILEFVGIRASKDAPIIKTVIVHDTIPVKQYVYDVRHDTVYLQPGTNKSLYTIDHYVDSVKAIPTEYKDDYFGIGISKNTKTSYGICHRHWGRVFKGVTDYTLGCRGDLINDLEGYPHWLWCTGEWVVTFREPLPTAKRAPKSHYESGLDDDDDDLLGIL